jgi:hypothetical protein
LLASGKAGIPQSWNRYTYVLNNPLKFTDPTGMMWVFHYLDKEHRRIGFGWISGNKISKDRSAQGYRAMNFGGHDSMDIPLTNGSVVRLTASSDKTVQLRPPDKSSAGQMYINHEAITEFNRQTAPIPRAVGAFVGISVAVGTGAGVVLHVTGALAGSGLTTLGLETTAPATEAATTATTIHGAEQLAARGFTEADISLTRTGTELMQEDGATVYLKEITPGRYNVLVEGERGVITALKNVPWDKVAKLASNYGWYSPVP